MDYNAMCIVLRVDPLRGLDTPPTFPGSRLRIPTHECC